MSTNHSATKIKKCSAATATSNMVVNASICKQKRSKGWHYLEDREDIRVAQLDKEVDIINNAGRNMYTLMYELMYLIIMLYESLN